MIWRLECRIACGSFWVENGAQFRSYGVLEREKRVLKFENKFLKTKQKESKERKTDFAASHTIELR